MRSSSIQPPSSREAPSLKHQTLTSVSLHLIPFTERSRILEVGPWSFSGAWMLVLGAFLSFGLSTFRSVASVPDKFANSDCLDCHTDSSNSRKVNGQTVPMAVFPTNRFDKSVHAKLSCVDCHTGIKDLVHESKLPAPNCVGCHPSQDKHEQAAKDYASSIHGVSHALGASGAANCWDCHGSHDILPVKNGESPAFKLNLPQTCAKCHSTPGLTKEYQIKHPDAASQYMA